MKTGEARALGNEITGLVQAGQSDQAYGLLAPVLAERTPFAMLRHIGEAIGAGSLEAANAFLERIAADKTEGGWVVVASALEGQLERDLAGAFERCRQFIIAADVWYGADTLGEGVPGRALVADFGAALELLRPWREDHNPWVRRACGSSAHYWAKRSRGAPELEGQAQELLAFLQPMFGEWDTIALKGVGWGLKTLGRQYPGLVTDWLAEQVLPNQSHYRALMLQKATKYLPAEQRVRIKQVQENYR
jgi:3-methyladenine DNA glycosylase AlkD